MYDNPLTHQAYRLRGPVDLLARRQLCVSRVVRRQVGSKYKRFSSSIQ